MTSARPSGEHMPSLTGLRFVAAFGVYVCHAAFLRALTHGGPSKLEVLGPVAVSLFFILSGFVLTRFARTTDTARAFWRRRVVKIYPSHLVAWVLVAAHSTSIGAALVQPGGSPLSLLPGVLLVHTWLPRFDLIGSGNIVVWSLACEVFFYLMFPLVLPLLRRIRPRRLPIAAACVAATVWAMPLLSYALGGAPAQGFPWPVPQDQLWFAYFLPVTRLPEFVLGMILALGLRSGEHRRWVGGWASSALLLASVLLGSAYLPSVFLFGAVGAVPLALLVRAVAVLDLRGARSPLRAPVLVFLGEISYCFYLVHALALLVTYRVTGDAWFGIATGVAGLVPSLLGAWLLHALVERPCMRRFARGRGPGSVLLPQQSTAAARPTDEASRPASRSRP